MNPVSIHSVAITTKMIYENNKNGPKPLLGYHNRTAIIVGLVCEINPQYEGHKYSLMAK